MNSIEAVSAVIDALVACQIEYMLVGAFAANAYGVGRSTNDADFVADVSSETIHDLMKQLGPDFRLDPQMQLVVFRGRVYDFSKLAGVILSLRMALSSRQFRKIVAPTPDCANRNNNRLRSS